MDFDRDFGEACSSDGVNGAVQQRLLLFTKPSASCENPESRVEVDRFLSIFP